MTDKTNDTTGDELYKGLISSSLDAIISTDSSFTILSWNSGAELIFSHAEQEVMGKPFASLLLDNNNESTKLQTTLLEGISSEVSKTIELVAVKQGGEHLPVELTFSSWNRGDELYYTFIIRDISERKRVEQAWQKLNNELEKGVKERTEELSRTNRELMQEIQIRKKAEKEYTEAMQLLEQSSRLASIGVMAAGINHEINQPLTAIKFHVDGLLYWEKKNKGAVPEIALDSLMDISEGIRRIDEIIRHMRSFWAQPAMTERVNFDLNETINKALSLLDRQLQLHKIKLTRILHAEALILHGIQVHMEQIVINLTVNALHALDFCTHSEKEIVITTGLSDNSIFITFSDNGPGMDIAAGDKIFDPFYSTKNQGEGMGLGLAIVRNFVEEYEGSITVSNRASGGAEFTIKIPRQETQNRENH